MALTETVIIIPPQQAGEEEGDGLDPGISLERLKHLLGRSVLGLQVGILRGI